MYFTLILLNHRFKLKLLFEKFTILIFLPKKSTHIRILTFRYLLTYCFYQFIVHRVPKLLRLLYKANKKTDTRSRHEIFQKAPVPGISDKYRGISLVKSIWTRYGFPIIFRNCHGSFCWKFSSSFFLLWKRFLKKIVHFNIF